MNKSPTDNDNGRPGKNRGLRQQVRDAETAAATAQQQKQQLQLQLQDIQRQLQQLQDIQRQLQQALQEKAALETALRSTQGQMSTGLSQSLTTRKLELESLRTRLLQQQGNLQLAQNNSTVTNQDSAFNLQIAAIESRRFGLSSKIALGMSTALFIGMFIFGAVLLGILLFLEPTSIPQFIKTIGIFGAIGSMLTGLIGTLFSIFGLVRHHQHNKTIDDEIAALTELGATVSASFTAALTSGTDLLNILATSINEIEGGPQRYEPSTSVLNLDPLPGTENLDPIPIPKTDDGAPQQSYTTRKSEDMQIHDPTDDDQGRGRQYPSVPTSGLLSNTNAGGTPSPSPSAVTESPISAEQQPSLM